MKKRFPPRNALIGTLLLGAAAADAAVLQVTTGADQFGEDLFACSLREAVQAVNLQQSFGGCNYAFAVVPPVGIAADRIVIGPRLIELSRTGPESAGNAFNDLDVLRDAEIVGTQGTPVTVTWQRHRAGRLFDVHAAQVRMAGMRLTGGSIPEGDGNGGSAILHRGGSLRLDGMVVHRNASNGDPFQGAVHSEGTLSMLGSAFTDNAGTAVFSLDGGVKIADSVFDAGLPRYEQGADFRTCIAVFAQSLSIMDSATFIDCAVLLQTASPKLFVTGSLFDGTTVHMNGQPRLIGSQLRSSVVGAVGDGIVIQRNSFVGGALSLTLSGPRVTDNTLLGTSILMGQSILASRQTTELVGNLFVDLPSLIVEVFDPSTAAPVLYGNNAATFSDTAVCNLGPGDFSGSNNRFVNAPGTCGRLLSLPASATVSDLLLQPPADVGLIVGSTLTGEERQTVRLPTLRSPLIDAGTDAFGLDAVDQLGNPRVLGAAVDIGPIETAAPVGG